MPKPPQDRPAGMKKAEGEAGYFTAPPQAVFPQDAGGFDVFLRQGAKFIHYGKAGSGYTRAHREKLLGLGLDRVHIPVDQKDRFARHAEEHLAELLINELIPLSERAGVLYLAAEGLAKEAIQDRPAPVIGAEIHARLVKLVDAAVGFLGRDGALKVLEPYFRREYETWSHCLQVMIYSIAVLINYGIERPELDDCGLGAFLHDIGKVRISREILNKKGELAKREWVEVKNHPTLGMSLCARLPLSQTSLNCIMFHHEHTDGGGYPGGLKAEKVPLPARVVGLCDAFDAMTSQRPHKKAMTPYEALNEMRGLMGKQFDEEAYAHLVMVLSKAELA